ncbi:hypothetical protein GMI70_08980 [Eggerthellaceae bacterium zg-893]|nr:hypothetical protein [Eggerthellaceae bacterium zg-893]
MKFWQKRKETTDTRVKSPVVVCAMAAALCLALMLAGCSQGEAGSSAEGASDASSAVGAAAAASDEAADSSAAEPEADEAGQPSEAAEATEASDELPVITLSFNGAQYDLVMDDTATSRELLALVPSSRMALPPSHDRDGVWKYYDMATGVSEDPEPLESAQAGDVLLDGPDRLILVYEDTPLDGSYTHVGTVEDVDGLAEALGDGDVDITIIKNERS